MARVIIARLHERGQNSGLFEGEVVGGGSAAHATASAAGGETGDTEYVSREKLFANYDKALRAGDEENADWYHSKLKEHHRMTQHGAGVDARPSGYDNRFEESRKRPGGNLSVQMQLAAAAWRPLCEARRRAVPSRRASAQEWLAYLRGE